MSTIIFKILVTGINIRIKTFRLDKEYLYLYLFLHNLELKVLFFFEKFTPQGVNKYVDIDASKSTT